jgi:hypothetical protein
MRRSAPALVPAAAAAAVAVAAVVVVVVAPTASLAAPRCRLVERPWLEGRRGEGGAPSRAVDARLGETLHVFVAAPALVDGKRLVLGDSGARGRTPFSAVADACGAPRITWRRVEPRAEHVDTPAPNGDVKVYANAVVFGPKHGTWLGYDRLEYVETPIAEQAAARLDVTDARPSEATGVAPRTGPAALLGTMRLAARVELAGAQADTPGAEDAPAGQISSRVFRYSFRAGDDFLGWLSSFYNVPYLFGSAGKGARNQAERAIGADCADVLVAALRRSGHRTMEYSSVAGLVDQLERIAGPVEIAPDEARRVRWGGPDGVRPGDLLAIDYVDFDGLPKAWDHIVALVEDRGPNGAPPDGLLGPEDLVIDTGDKIGLKVAPLAHQGHVRVAVLRPRGGGRWPDHRTRPR